MKKGPFLVFSQVIAVLAFLAPTSALGQQQANTGTPPFLYVVVADDAKIENQGGDYVLRLERGEIDHVLEIGEKPFELKNFISSDKIVATWKANASNFGPGVTMKGTVLSDDGAVPGINIKSISKTAREMRFVFSLDNNAQLDLRRFGKLDDVTIVNYCCRPGGGSGDWLWGQ